MWKKPITKMKCFVFIMYTSHGIVSLFHIMRCLDSKLKLDNLMCNYNALENLLTLWINVNSYMIIGSFMGDLIVFVQDNR